MSEPRRFLIYYSDDGRARINGRMLEDETLDVIEKSAYDALAAENELLKQSKTQLESEIGLLKESVIQLRARLNIEVNDSSYVRNQWHQECTPLKSALATCQKQLDFAEREAKYLWGLLDDIDTAGDQFKPERNGYFKAICKLVADRFTNLKSDGYSLKWADHTPLADMHAVEGKK